jgi:hypothetical protein
MSRLTRFVAVAAIVGCFPGCAVLVQNRYSVFGFDRLQTESPDEARVWSFALLGCVAVSSAVLGASGLWLSQRVYRRWRKASDTSGQQVIPDPAPLAMESLSAEAAPIQTLHVTGAVIPVSRRS